MDKMRSLLIARVFEPIRNLSLEWATENEKTCKLARARLRPDLELALAH